MKAAESDLFCVKGAVDWVNFTVVGRYVVEEYADGEKGMYDELEREISIENRFFTPLKSRFKKYYYGYILKLYMLYN